MKNEQEAKVDELSNKIKKDLDESYSTNNPRRPKLSNSFNLGTSSSNVLNKNSGILGNRLRSVSKRRFDQMSNQ